MPFARCPVPFAKPSKGGTVSKMLLFMDCGLLVNMWWRVGWVARQEGRWRSIPKDTAAGSEAARGLMGCEREDENGGSWTIYVWP